MTQKPSEEPDPEKRATEWQDSLEKFVRRRLDGPTTLRRTETDSHALLASHLLTGIKFKIERKLPEAIAEFSKEHARPIHSEIDAEIVQKSYWHVGRVWIQMGEVEKAIVAFQQAAEILEEKGVGASPYGDLAEIFIEQRRFDAAIEMYEKALRLWPRDRGAQEMLRRAIELRDRTS